MYGLRALGKKIQPSSHSQKYNYRIVLVCLLSDALCSDTRGIYFVLPFICVLPRLNCSEYIITRQKGLNAADAILVKNSVFSPNFRQRTKRKHRKVLKFNRLRCNACVPRGVKSGLRVFSFLCAFPYRHYMGVRRRDPPNVCSITQ